MYGLGSTLSHITPVCRGRQWYGKQEESFTFAQGIWLFLSRDKISAHVCALVRVSRICIEVGYACPEIMPV